MEMDTFQFIPDGVEFKCTVCKQSIFDKKRADVFVYVRKPSNPCPRSFPTDLWSEKDILEQFNVEPRCRHHVASHQRPAIPYDKGKQLAWRGLPEEKRRFIIVKFVMES